MSQLQIVQTVLGPTIDVDTINVLRTVLEASIAVADRDTAYEPDQKDWSKSDPLHGHCGVIAEVIQLILGGEVMSGRDEYGVRWLWNRLPSGLQVSLTSLDPFFVTLKGRVVPPRKYRNQRFLTFFERVYNKINA